MRRTNQRRCWTIAALLIVASTTGAAERAPVEPFETSVEPTADGRIDALVLDSLKEAGIAPSYVCSDAVFLRRAYLDVIGTLPTAQQARAFLADGNANKRSELIDRLLEQDEFADYWSMKWGDLLRIKAEFPINLWPNSVQAYHRWVRTAIKQNMPYDRFARELLTASGSNFRVPQVNFYRAVQSTEPEAIARAVALTFMGARAERWPKDRLSGLAAFFSRLAYKRTDEWKEEIVFFDALDADSDADSGQPMRAIFPDGTPARIPPGQDPREVLADWLTAPDNPWFARAAVNRVWCWLMGRGIVHEPDDLRPDNLPSNPELLAYLEQQLVDSHYDLRHIYRLILNSQTYQLSSIPHSDDPDAEKLFAYYPLRRLDAEVLIDALCQVTGTHEEYSSAIPEPFTFIPDDQRSIALADGSITSSFLELFGRPPRDTGLAAERNNRMTAAQRLHLLNSSHIQKKIQQSPKLRALMFANRRTPMKAVTGLYLTVLSRFPTQEELEVVRSHVLAGGARGPEAAVDLAWALVNSAEFLYRH